MPNLVKNFVAALAGSIRSSTLPHHSCCWNSPMLVVRLPSGFATPEVSQSP
nr:hypothetical protein [Microbacterium suwonense]